MPEPRYFSGPEVLAIAEQVVAEFGHDYEYPIAPMHERRGVLKHGNGCAYVRDGKPSCIVAQIMARMGGTVEWMSENELTSARRACGWATEFEASPAPTNPWFRVSERTADALSVAQSLQDGGATWGVCLDKLREMLPLD